jgi:hypothetical protein
MLTFFEKTMESPKSANGLPVGLLGWIVYLFRKGLLLMFIPLIASFSGVVNAENILIQRDDFDASLSPTDWIVTTSVGSASARVDAAQSQLVLETVPNVGVGTARVSGTKAFSVLNGPLVFTARIIDAYVDQAIYGDAQPRGLMAGTDANNAIVFVNAMPTPNNIACRTVANGAVTQTVVNIGQNVRSPAVYQIIAAYDSVKFYVNGKLVAVHTTNIPAIPLNVHFSTGDSGAGNVPVTIDWVTYERVQ